VELATELMARVAAMTPSEWLTAISVAALIGAIAWIGRNVGRLLDGLVLIQARVRLAEESVARIDEAVAKRLRNLEARQDRLQLRFEHQGKDWRDSMRRTEERTSGEFDMTKFDLRKPE
jgi:hypothetical protein